MNDETSGWKNRRKEYRLRRIMKKVDKAVVDAGLLHALYGLPYEECIRVTREQNPKVARTIEDALMEWHNVEWRYLDKLIGHERKRK